MVAIRSYVAQATFKSERTGEQALIQAAQCLGFTIGPGIQAAFSPIGCSSLANSGGPYFALDTYTSCGWFTALLGIVCLGLYFPKASVISHPKMRCEEGTKSRKREEAFLICDFFSFQLTARAYLGGTVTAS